MVIIPFHNVQIGFSNQQSFALKNHVLLSSFQHFPSVATNSNSVMKSLLKLTLVHQLTEARQGARLPLSSTFGGSVVRVGHRQSPYSLVADIPYLTFFSFFFVDNHPLPHWDHVDDHVRGEVSN